MGVLKYGEKAVADGLSLLQGPGNDIVAISGMMASGCHVILFSTGRGTPVGSPVPTVKIATNTPLAERKSNWIDWNAGRLVEDKKMDEYAEEFFKYILDAAFIPVSNSSMVIVHYKIFYLKTYRVVLLRLFSTSYIINNFISNHLLIPYISKIRYYS